MASNYTCWVAFNSSEFALVPRLATASGVVCFLCAVWTMIVIVASNGLRDYNYRLIFYYCVATAAFGAANSLNRIHWFVESAASNDFCAWAGFFFQCTVLSLVAAALAANLSMTVKVGFGWEHRRTEPLSMFCIFVAPLLISWVPFVVGAYGRSRDFCYITGVNRDCTMNATGVALLVALLWVPWIAASLVVVVASVVCTAAMIHRTRSEEDNRPRRGGGWGRVRSEGGGVGGGVGRSRDGPSLVKRVARRAALSLLWCPFVLILLQLPLLVRTLYDQAYPEHPLPWMWCVSNTLSALDPGLIAIGYTFRKHLLFVRRCKEAVLECACRCRKRDRTWSSEQDSFDGYVVFAE